MYRSTQELAQRLFTRLSPTGGWFGRRSSRQRGQFATSIPSHLTLHTSIYLIILHEAIQNCRGVRVSPRTIPYTRMIFREANVQDSEAHNHAATMGVGSKIQGVSQWSQTCLRSIQMPNKQRRDLGCLEMDMYSLFSETITLASSQHDGARLSKV